MDFSGITVLCVGDLMLDRFVYGDVERISPEAPIPVLRLSRTREMLGGAGNVASNVASLGGRAILTGVAGRDGAGAAIERIMGGQPGLVPNLVLSDDRPTICKTRYIAAQQQVVRTDEESLLPLTPTEEAGVIAAAEPWITRVNAVVLADYGKGVLTPAVIGLLIAKARAAGVPVFVDPKTRDFTRYRGATCITPNLRELALAAGEPLADEAAITAAARSLVASAEVDAILVTRSEKGMMLVEASGEVHSVRAKAREVFDVSGAGDTVIAAMALCYATGRSFSQSMHVANAAGAVVVSKRGTATASVAEVVHELDAQDQARDHDLQAGTLPGVQSLHDTRELVARWKEQGLVVGLTNGCFDIIHPGHVALLAQARSECDRLVVALNTDASVQLLKGPARPVNGLAARAQVMAAIRYVHCVVAFDEPTPLALISALVPDVLVKGADYAVGEVVGAGIVQAAGGRVVLAKLIAGQSTTNVIKRLQVPGATA